MRLPGLPVVLLNVPRTPDSSLTPHRVCSTGEWVIGGLWVIWRGSVCGHGLPIEASLKRPSKAPTVSQWLADKKWGGGAQNNPHPPGSPSNGLAVRCPCSLLVPREPHPVRCNTALTIHSGSAKCRPHRSTRPLGSSVGRGGGPVRSGACRTQGGAHHRACVLGRGWRGAVNAQGHGQGAGSVLRSTAVLQGIVHSVPEVNVSSGRRRRKVKQHWNGRDGYHIGHGTAGLGVFGKMTVNAANARRLEGCQMSVKMLCNAHRTALRASLELNVHAFVVACHLLHFHTVTTGAPMAPLICLFVLSI